MICRLEAELHRPVQRWPVTLLMRLQQALLHPHPMESNPAWAQTGATMLPRIHFHRVRAEYQPAARLEQPLLVSSVWRDLPNARRFQGQTCSVSCEDSKNIYIWYPDQDQSRVFWRSPKSSVFFTLRYDQQYYKQAGKRTLTLRTFFKSVWGSGWGDKKQPVPGCARDKLRFSTS